MTSKPDRGSGTTAHSRIETAMDHADAQEATATQPSVPQVTPDLPQDLIPEVASMVLEEPETQKLVSALMVQGA